MRRERFLLPIFLLMGACGSTDDPATIAFASTTTIATDRATDQISLDGLLTTTTSTPSSSDTTAAPPDNDCGIEPGRSYLVNVSPTDPDGGLNLRNGAGVSNEVVIVLPAGTEVEPSGECNFDNGGGEWWHVRAVTDASVEGWVSAGFLDRRDNTECPAGLADPDDLMQVSSTSGDFDGDGSADLLYLGNNVQTEKAVMQVEFANGGFAGGEIDSERYADVNAVFRPIGAAHDIVMFRDVFSSGAHTNTWLLAEIADCAPLVIDGLMEGGSVGFGDLGYCLEPTSLGVRVWGWSATNGNTPEERQASRVDFPLHYYRSTFVDGTGTTDGRECAEPEAETGYFGGTVISTDLASIEAPTIGELGPLLASHFGASSSTMVGEPIGLDAQGGQAIWMLSGLQDDSIDGYRLLISFTIEQDSDGNVTKFRTASGEFWPLCSRGVTESGLCV